MGKDHFCLGQTYTFFVTVFRFFFPIVHHDFLTLSLSFFNKATSRTSKLCSRSKTRKKRFTTKTALSTAGYKEEKNAKTDSGQPNHYYNYLILIIKQHILTITKKMISDHTMLIKPKKKLKKLSKPVV